MHIIALKALSYAVNSHVLNQHKPMYYQANSSSVDAQMFYTRSGSHNVMTADPFIAIIYIFALEDMSSINENVQSHIDCGKGTNIRPYILQI